MAEAIKKSPTAADFHKYRGAHGDPTAMIG